MLSLTKRVHRRKRHAFAEVIVIDGRTTTAVKSISTGVLVIRQVNGDGTHVVRDSVVHRTIASGGEVASANGDTVVVVVRGVGVVCEVAGTAYGSIIRTNSMFLLL